MNSHLATVEKPQVMGNTDTIQDIPVFFGQPITINIAECLFSASQNSDWEPHEPQYYQFPKLCLLVFLKHHNSLSFQAFGCAISFNINVGSNAGWAGMSQGFFFIHANKKGRWMAIMENFLDTWHLPSMLPSPSLFFRRLPVSDHVFQPNESLVRWCVLSFPN